MSLTKLSALDALKDFLSDPLLGVRATILLRIDWHSGLIGALLWRLGAAKARFRVLPCRVICLGGAEVVRRMAPHELQRIP